MAKSRNRPPRARESPNGGAATAGITSFSFEEPGQDQNGTPQGSRGATGQFSGFGSGILEGAGNGIGAKGTGKRTNGSKQKRKA